MNARLITFVIIGAAFGFTQLWFVYWVVKLFKEKQRILGERAAAAKAAAKAAKPARARRRPDTVRTDPPAAG